MKDTNHFSAREEQMQISPASTKAEQLIKPIPTDNMQLKISSLENSIPVLWWQVGRKVPASVIQIRGKGLWEVIPSEYEELGNCESSPFATLPEIMSKSTPFPKYTNFGQTCRPSNRVSNQGKLLQGIPEPHRDCHWLIYCI